MLDGNLVALKRYEEKVQRSEEICEQFMKDIDVDLFMLQDTIEEIRVKADRYSEDYGIEIDVEEILSEVM